MHPNTLQRMLDSELYGNRYKLVTFMTELNNMMFNNDIKENKKIISFRRHLQTAYVEKLIDMISKDDSLKDDSSKDTNNKLSSTSKSMAYYNLSNIKIWINKYTGNNLATKAHVKYLNSLIDNAL